MNTLILSGDNEKDIQNAGKILNGGGLVAIPTETVYGLAANALNPVAVQNIFKAKGRPSDNPLIVHISEFDEIYPLVKFVPEIAKTLCEKFWAGPLTIILEKSDLIPNETSGGLSTVAIRMPQSEIARGIIKASKCPLAAPSANISGKPSPTKFAHVYEDMNGKIEGIVKGEDCTVGVESTVLTLATNPPKILRPGAVSYEDLRKFIPNLEIHHAVTEHLENDEKADSPGMKYKHYSPKADITISHLSFNEYKQFLENNPEYSALCFDGEENEINCKAVSYGEIYNSKSQAQRLFSALHELDEKGFAKVLARAPKKNGVGLAVFNRLIRACGFKEFKANVKIIGLTGTTGSGKSTVANSLKKLDYKVIDCDKISRDEETYKGECLQKLIKAFGSEIVENGSLNRKKLAQKAFVSKEKTELLNSITLPVISRKIEKMIADYVNLGAVKIVLDAPTLFEANADRLCTHILAVTASKNLRIKRIIKRDNITEEMARARMNAQHSSDYYIERADFVINTDDNKIDINEFNLYLEGN